MTEVERFAPGVKELAASIEVVLAPEAAATARARNEELVAAGVPAALAQRIAAVDGLISACDIVEVAAAARAPVLEAARVYFQLGGRLNIEWLRGSAEALDTGSHWQHRAVRAIVDDLYGQQRALTLAVLKGSEAGTNADERIAAWIEANKTRMTRALDTLDELRRDAPFDLAKLAVANRQVRALIVA